jgi:hypothetical protein
MASSPFGCNAKKNLFSGKAKAAQPAPGELVTLEVTKFQVITAIIPFNTKQAPNIRQDMHNHCVYDSQKIFMFRAVNGWTNIALDSTEETPKLTCDPQSALKIAWRVFNDSPYVSRLVMKSKESGKEFGYDDIDNLEFDDLPEASGDSDTRDKTDADVLYDLSTKISLQLTKLDQKMIALDKKVDYIVGTLDTYYKDYAADDEAVHNNEADDPAVAGPLDEPEPEPAPEPEPEDARPAKKKKTTSNNDEGSSSGDPPATGRRYRKPASK